MDNTELFHIMEECKKNILERRNNIKDANDMRIANEWIIAIDTDMAIAKMSDNQETLDNMFNKYKMVYERLFKKKYVTSKMTNFKQSVEHTIPNVKNCEPDTTNKHKVVYVVPEEKQNEYIKISKKKVKAVCTHLGVGALAAVIALSVKTGKNNVQDEESVTLECAEPLPTITATAELASTEPLAEKVYLISTLDVTNDDSILTVANYISENYTTDLSIDEIVSAIKLLNLDSREDLGDFEDKESVYKSTIDAGKLILSCGSDEVIAKSDNQDIYVSEDILKDILANVTDNNLTIENFVDAKTENNTYDIYKLCEICTMGMYGEENAFYYAKAYNDIVARFEYNFSICSESPIATICAITGMYNYTMDKTNELTAGQGLSTCYGDNILNDGTYGSICVEELAKFVKIGNEEGIYSLIVDDQIISKSLALQ